MTVDGKENSGQPNKHVPVEGRVCGAADGMAGPSDKRQKATTEQLLTDSGFLVTILSDVEADA